jgi:hypothetical protein
LNGERQDLVQAAMKAGADPDTIRFAFDVHEQTPEAEAGRDALKALVRAMVAVDQANEALERAGYTSPAE